MEINERILRLAEFTVEVYGESLAPESRGQILQVINEFRKYYKNAPGDYWDLYDIVEGEDGIWLNMDDSSRSDREQEMWCLETCLLNCLIVLELDAHNQVYPEDLEMKSENIPNFVTFMEKNFNSVPNFSACLNYYNKHLCY